MKKITIYISLVLALTLSVCRVSKADTYPQKETDWRIVYDGGNSLKTNYTSSDVSNAIKGMQPGDTAHLRFIIENRTNKEASWWMENYVIKSLEDDSAAHNGAYTYELIYKPSMGDDVIIFSSKEVGGSANADTDREGLHQATEALNENNLDENYFFLEELPAHASGELVLTLKLDGESQANDYQNTLARLRLRFAVEVITVEPKKIVYTGNRDDNQVSFSWQSALGIGLILCSSLYLYLSYRKEKAHEIG